MVQNGKFSAEALAESPRRLKSEDLPTLGRPTMPIFSVFFTRPKRGRGSATAPFFRLSFDAPSTTPSTSDAICQTDEGS
jgi:hypothetical protein